MTTDSDFSEDVLRDCVRKSYDTIVRSFDPKGPVLNKLFQYYIINPSQKKHIESIASEDRCAALVDILLSSSRPKTMARFLEILATVEFGAHNWIAEVVYEAAKKKVSPPPSLCLRTEELLEMSQHIETFSLPQTNIYNRNTQQTVERINSTHPSHTEVLSNDNIKNQIRSKYTLIWKNVDPRYDILSILFEKQILSPEKLEYLRGALERPCKMLSGIIRSSFCGS